MSRKPLIRVMALTARTGDPVSASAGRGIASRLKSNLSRRIKLICPVQSSMQRYSASFFAQIIFTTEVIPLLHEGRFAIVTDVGRDAVDAGGALTKALILADGEVVWS